MDKLKDCLIGFFGGGAFLGVFIFILTFLFEIFRPYNYSDSYEIISIIGSIVLVLATIVFLIYNLIKMKRKYILYGFIGVFTIPLFLILFLVFVFWGYLF